VFRGFPDIETNGDKDQAENEAGVQRSFLLFKTIIGSISHDIQK